jgi:hypothetical protein
LSNGLAAVAALLVLILPMTAGSRLGASLSQTDLREVAGQWVEENVDPGSRIAIEHYSVPFDHDGYDVQDIIRFGDRTLEWYRQEGFDIIVISDGVWEILRQEPEHYADRLAPYDELANSGTQLAEFIPEPPALTVAGYPTVAVYHFAPVRIYRLPR